MNTSAWLRSVPQLLRLCLLIVAFSPLASAQAWAGEPVGTSEGAFSDALPGHDPVVPYGYDRPQHVIWDSKAHGLPTVSWGSPMTADGQIIVDSENVVWADGSGLHRATFEDGELFQVPAAWNWPQVVPEEAWRYTSWMAFGGLQVPVGTPDTFTVGHLSFHNGVNGTGTGIESVNLAVSVWDGTAVFATDTLRIVVTTTVNTGATPEQNADYIHFANHPEFGSFRVLEGGTATIELLAKYGSLHVQGFGDVVEGAGFWSPTINIPEPVAEATVAGLGLVGLAARRRWIRRHSGQ